MRESSGRRQSSKRPLSCWSSSVTSAWKRRPFLSTRTMSPGAMPLEVMRGSGGGGGAGVSIRLCCTSVTLGPAADGLQDRLPDAPVELDVLRAIGPHLDDRRARAEGVVERGAERRRGVDALVAEPVQRGGMGEVEPVRRGDVALEIGALALDREEVEDAAAVVVDQHDREVELQAARGEQAADVVGERDVAGEQHGAVAGGGDAEGGGDGAVDAVGAAVGQYA